VIATNARINGSHVTGVQRYLQEILRRMPEDVRVIQPSRYLDGVRGHIWEQSILPRAASASLLWSPSNTGPLSMRNQVVTIHDVVPLDHPEWLNWRFAAWYRFLLPRLVHRVRGVIAISEFTKRRLISTTGVPAEKVVVIPNGVDARFTPAAKARIEDVKNLLPAPAQRYLLTVGSLEPRKNLRRLLLAWSEALRDLPEDVWLVVAGAKGKSVVFAQSAGLEELPERVFLPGYVADDVLPALYACATGFAYISEYEGFGLPPLEAMASGVPVMVSATTAFPEVVGDAGLLVDPLDVQAIARGLVKLLTEPDFAEELAGRGLQRARQFSWDRTAELTLGALRDAGG
jgi:glycosyltransferase involved in cell wall biosynthesis